MEKLTLKRTQSCNSEVGHSKDGNELFQNQKVGKLELKYRMLFALENAKRDIESRSPVENNRSQHHKTKIEAISTAIKEIQEGSDNISYDPNLTLKNVDKALRVRSGLLEPKSYKAFCNEMSNIKRIFSILNDYKKDIDAIKHIIRNDVRSLIEKIELLKKDVKDVVKYQIKRFKSEYLQYEEVEGDNLGNNSNLDDEAEIKLKNGNIKNNNSITNPKDGLLSGYMDLLLFIQKNSAIFQKHIEGMINNCARSNNSLVDFKYVIRRHLLTPITDKDTILTKPTNPSNNVIKEHQLYRYKFEAVPHYVKLDDGSVRIIMTLNDFEYFKSMAHNGAFGN